MNIISRRSFLERASLAGAGLGIAALTNVPLVMKRALASTIGQGSFAGKKVLFIWLRFGNDGLNSHMPVGDPNYFKARTANTGYNGTATPGDANVANNGNLAMPLDVAHASDYTTKTGFVGGSNNFEDGSNYLSSPANTPAEATASGTYKFQAAIPARDGFSAFSAAHKFMVPVYNAGNLAVIHRTGYRAQSRSHFDSQNYWENAIPGNNLLREGMLYRAINRSGLSQAGQAITGVTYQAALPLLMQGDAVALTNIADPARFQDGFQGVPLAADAKGTAALTAANGYQFPSKQYRDLLSLQYKNLTDTLTLFSSIPFADSQNIFTDDVATDGDNDFYSQAVNTGINGGKRAGEGYYLFPHNNNVNGGWLRPGGTVIGGRYVIQQNGTPGAGHYGNMKSLKAAALTLNYTDALVAGTEIGGFDTHNNEIPGSASKFTGAHFDLHRWIGWAIYGLYKYFTLYGKQENGSQPTKNTYGVTLPAAKAKWSDIVVVTLSEFGRTSIQNTTFGTDHAEAGVCWVAGGGVRGLDTADVNNAAGRKGVKVCNTDSALATYNGQNIAWDASGSFNVTTGLVTGTETLFNAAQRYLQRGCDYRSIFGEIIRKHLGADGGAGNVPSADMKYIIPGYGTASENLYGGGVCTDGTRIAGELGLLAGS